MDERTPPRAVPDTVVEAVDQLEADGYVGDLHVRDGGLHCSACGEVAEAHALEIDRIYRFEGASDPDDEAIVLGLACPCCGAKGVLVAAYGPAADADEVAVLGALVDRRRR